MKKKNPNKNLKGVIRWFDNLSGEGMVRLETDESIFVHWSAVKGKFPPNHGKESWVEFEKGTPVIVDVIRDTHFRQVSRLKVVK